MGKNDLLTVSVDEETRVSFRLEPSNKVQGGKRRSWERTHN
jgi:hypothetical protein